MSDDKKKDLEKKLTELPPTAKGFVEGYGEGTAGWKPDPKDVPRSQPQVFLAAGYDFNFSAATNRVCARCSAVVADTDVHDQWHDSIQALLDEDDE